jgi:TonB family protein
MNPHPRKPAVPRGTAKPVFVVSLLLLLLIGAGPLARAQDEEASPGEIEAWQNRLERAESQLEKESQRRAVKAQEMCLEVLKEMAGRLDTNPSAPQLYGKTLFLLAVAEKRLGSDRLASWYWLEAQNIQPTIRSRSLEAYPDVAPGFEENRLTVAKREQILAKAEAEPAAGAEIPAPAHMVPISYPGGARRRGIEGTTEVVLVIDEIGVPVTPVLRQSCGVPGFDVAVMEAAGQWHFEPASFNGQPVTGTYVLTATFHLGGG